jgi:F-type H+-transporting ATPase subunit b
MDNLLSVNPGTIIWTIVNFGIFLFIILKFGLKPIANGLKAREDRINTAIENAEKANANASTLLKESQEKLDNAQREMQELISKGRQQAESIVKKAAEEAEKVKQTKVAEAQKEIERSKDAALLELRSEVAGLVIKATEMILNEKLNDERHQKLIESYIEKLPKN